MNRRSLFGLAALVPFIKPAHAAGRRHFVVIDGTPLFTKGLRVELKGGLVIISDKSGQLLSKAPGDVVIEVD